MGRRKSISRNDCGFCCMIFYAKKNENNFFVTAEYGA